ncbi:MAG: LPXTG cell wall anchor domain-containing protein [Vagococcus sp.]|uniref:LPXTG cell wall anchor domain-containing protein n=1 Tax=Vagococcus sp. TaxID=1933889 RepID=UPI002FC705C7
MKKAFFCLMTSLLFVMVVPNVLAEESKSGENTIPTTETQDSSSTSTTQESSDSSEEKESSLANIDSVRMAKIRMVQIYLANGYITQEKHDEVIAQLKNATTEQELNDIMNVLMGSVDKLTEFTSSFSEKYYNVEAGIASAISKGMITEAQGQSLYDKLAVATTIDELQAIFDELTKMINETTGTSSTSSSTSTGDSSSIKSSSKELVTTNQSKKGILPQTGEVNKDLYMIFGLLLTASSFGIFVWKKL